MGDMNATTHTNADSTFMLVSMVNGVPSFKQISSAEYYRQIKDYAIEEIKQQPFF